jgi:hypothetical protein
MTNWNSRIQIRIDSNAAMEQAAPPRTLDAGELAASVKGGDVEIRVGVSAEQEFLDCPIVMKGSAGTQPLVIDGDAASGSGGSMLWWDGTNWQRDAEQIEWDETQASGAVVYGDATDEWETDPTLTIVADADGGIFTGSFTAPAFSSGYSPAIGSP